MHARIQINRDSFKIKHILERINPYVMWDYQQSESYGTTVRIDEYNPIWEETFEFRIPENNRHISYDGPIYNDDEEVGTFSYEIDFLPLEYSDEIVDKYNREMEAKRLEEEEQRELER